MSAPVADARVGSVLLGKLRVVRVLGAGGMGVVYEVEHLVTGHRRALKVLRRERSDDPKAVARLMREASIAGKVQSHRLVDTYDVGRLEDGATYLLMELLEGRTLADRLEAEGPLSPAETVRLGVQIAEGLGAAHAAGVLHRDLTPRNVFLVREGGEEQVRLVDFGLSKMIAGQTDRFGHLTGTGAFVGTPYYVSPEQAGGDPVDARADQYSLAVILYECLAGKRPYEGHSLLEVLGRIASGEHAPLTSVRPEVGAGVSRAISRALSRDPAARYPDVRAFVAGLTLEYGATTPLAVERPEAATSPMPASPPPRAEPARPRASSRSGSRPVRRSSGRAVGWWIAGFGLAGVLALGVAFGVTAWVLRRADEAAAEPAPTVTPAPTLPAGPGAGDAAGDPSITAGHLRGLYHAGDYRRCVLDGQFARRTVPVILVVLDCAEQGILLDEVYAACQELHQLAPRHPRAARCRHALRRYERGLAGVRQPPGEAP